MGNMYLKNDDILVITGGFWDDPKRMRHKMPLTWARAGNRILWIEQTPFPPHDWRKPNRLSNAVLGRLRLIEERFWVGSAIPGVPYLHRGDLRGHALRSLHRPLAVHRIRRYMEQLNFKPRIVTLIQQAARHDLLDHFPAPRTIYYSHDLFGYGDADIAAIAELKRCCEKVDMIWTTSEAQKEDLIQYNPNTHHFPHAVDIDWWEQNCDEVPPEYETIPHPRAVYTGVFQRKINLPLLIETANRCPNWNFVFVGPVQAHNIDSEKLAMAKTLSNVHFLGERDPNRLPGYISNADLLLLPYICDENRRFLGLALKFYEYMISGKPIIATPYTELETSHKDLLHIASNADEWVEILDSCSASKDLDKAKRRKALAYENSYAARLKAQRIILGETIG